MNKLINIRQGEWGLVLGMGFLLFFNSLALELADVVAVSGFLSQVDVSNILIVWVIDMLFIAIAASGQSLIVDRFDRRSVMRGIILVFIAAYAILRLLFWLNVPAVVNFAILFLLVEQQWIFFPLVFWVLANDITQLAQAKRLFPLIAAFAFAGQIAGLGLASASPRLLQIFDLDLPDTLIFNGLVYVLTFVVMLFSLRRLNIPERPQRAGEKQSVRETLSEGAGFVRDVPSFRYLTLVMLMTAIVVTILDFHFLRIADQSFKAAPPGSFQTFYGIYRLVVTLVAITVQTFITARLIENFHLKNVFILLPFFMIASIGLVGIPALYAVVGGRALFRVAQTSIDEPSRKAFLSLVPDHVRGRVSVFLDSYVFVVGVITGCIMLGLIMWAGNSTGLTTYVYLALAFVAALIAVWAAFHLRRVYDQSLLNWRLRKRKATSSVMDKLNF